MSHQLRQVKEEHWPYRVLWLLYRRLTNICMTEVICFACGQGTDGFNRPVPEWQKYTRTRCRLENLIAKHHGQQWVSKQQIRTRDLFHMTGYQSIVVGEMAHPIFFTILQQQISLTYILTCK